MKISSAGFSGFSNGISSRFERELVREMILAFSFVGLFVAIGEVGTFVAEGELSGKDASEIGLLFLSFNELGERLCSGAFGTCSILSCLDSVCLSLFTRKFSVAPSIVWMGMQGVFMSFIGDEVTFVSRVSSIWECAMSSSKGGSSILAGWLREEVVWGFSSAFLQLLEVWPVDLHRKQVILSSVKNTLNSV